MRREQWHQSFKGIMTKAKALRMMRLYADFLEAEPVKKVSMNVGMCEVIARRPARKE